jgi:hypothetical protein
MCSSTLICARDRGIDQFMDAVPQPQPPKARGGEDQAVVLAGIELFQAGDHVAPHIAEAEVGKVMAQLGQAAQGAGAHHTALGQGGEGPVPVLCMHHQGIGRVLPLGDAAQHQPFGQVGGQVLEAVHGDVGPVHQHLGLEFLGEQTLVADLGQSHIKDLVPLGGHRLDADLQRRVGPGQLVPHPVGLHHGQPTATGGDAQVGAGREAAH